MFSNLFLRNSYITITRNNHPQPYLPEYFRFYNSICEEITSTSLLITQHTSYPVYLIIEECIFHNCSSTLNSGVIYYIPNDGNCSLTKVCASNCYHTPSTSNYQFGVFQTTNNDDRKLLFSFVSVSGCPFHSSGNRNEPIRLSYGKQFLTNFNLSHNTGQKNYIGIVFYHYRGAEMNYTTFGNCSGSNSYGFYLYERYSSYFNMFYSNFIGNTLPYYLIGVDISGFFIQNSCIFIANTCSSALFLRSSGQWILLFCVIMNIGPISYSGHPTITAQFAPLNIITNSIITSTYNLEHYSTKFCYAVYPGPKNNTNSYISLPPSPTECLIESKSNLKSLNILSVLDFTSFLNLIYLLMN